MTLNEVKAAIRKEIASIKADDRFRQKPTQVQINAPLALVQVDLKAKLQTLQNVLLMLSTVRVARDEFHST